jgi:hypothetical protein
MHSFESNVWVHSIVKIKPIPIEHAVWMDYQREGSFYLISKSCASMDITKNMCSFATNGAGTAYPSSALKFIPGF